MKGRTKRIFQAVKHRVSFYLNMFFFNIFKLFPLKKQTIIFESEGDYCDNAFALFSYLRTKKSLDKYKAVWAVVDTSDKCYQKYIHTSVMDKNMYHLNIKASYYLATSKFFIYDHNNLYSKLRKRKKQQMIYLSHGRGFKASKGVDYSKIKTPFDVMFTTGQIGTEGLSYFWKCDKKMVKELGYPRNDRFFSDLNHVKNKIINAYQLHRFNHIFLWMPTFRKTNNQDISEDYLNNETGLPLFNGVADIDLFNLFLAENKICVLLKVHHLQSDLPIWKKSYSNIRMIKDEELKGMDIQLYEFVGICDALITDYSSIAFDYMLLDRPIIFTVDDYEAYKKSRGFYPENAIDYMAGYHIENIDALKKSFTEICNGQDIYRKDRAKIMPLFFTYTDGYASERILNYLNID